MEMLNVKGLTLDLGNANESINQMTAKTSAFWASWIDLILDAICVVDKEGLFVFVSAASEYQLILVPLAIRSGTESS